MSNETYVTIIGTLHEDPELRFTQSGAAVANFTVRTNARKLNRQSNEWEKKPTKFWRCQAWNQGKALLAENTANSLKKGDTVIVYGEIETREYETQDGQKRSVDELRVEGIGKDLRWHQAYANDVPAASGLNTQEQGGWGAGQPAAGNNAAGDPWASSTQGAGGWGNDSGSPF